MGTGVGVGAAWLLAGMDGRARLTTLEVHPKAASISREVFAVDDRGGAGVPPSTVIRGL